MPGPLQTVSEKIQIGNNADKIPNHTYVYATKWGNRQIAEQYKLAKRREGWLTFEIASGHDMMIDAPDELSRLLVSAS